MHHRTVALERIWKWGHRSGAKRTPPLFWLYIQLFVLVGAFVMISTVWSIFCLLFFYSWCSRVQPFVKVGSTCPPVPHGVGANAFTDLQQYIDLVTLIFALSFFFHKFYPALYVSVFQFMWLFCFQATHPSRFTDVCSLEKCSPDICSPDNCSQATSWRCDDDSDNYV